MAEKYRSLQLLRNAEIAEVANHGEARSNFAKVSLTKVKDGEIILYSYTIQNEEVSTGVHTLVGVVRENNSAKHLEILGNYDFLHNEIVNALAEAKTYTDTKIDALDTTITNHVEDGKEPVIVSITQVDGLLTSVTVDVKNLSDNFQEIINALDYTHTAGNTDKKTFNIYATNQEAGQISEVVDGTIYFTDEVTETNPGATKKYVDDKIAGLNTPEGGVSSEADQNILVTVEQENGIVTSVSVDETALNAKFDELEAATTLEGVEAIEVSYGETTNTVSLKLAEETILTQDDNGLKATLSIVYNSDDKQIELHGVNGVIGTPIDATDFIKDGMLEDAEIITATNEEGLTPGKRYIKFTFKTYQQGQEGVEELLKVEYLDVESLFDSYTADEQWIHIDQDTNTISHKTIDGLDSTDPHGITDEVTVNSTTEQTFNVPTLKVDAAGHVTSVDEKTVTIALPKSIDTAVQTVTSTEAVNATNKFVAVHATRAEGSNDVVLTSEVKTQAVKDATADQNGLATAADVKQFVLDNSASVIATETETTVAKSTTQPYTYTVGLADVTQTDDNTATSSFADANNTFTFVKAVNVDGKGRVTGVVTETVTEDFDCGLY